LSLGSGVLTSSLRRLTRPASALFRAGQQPYPASYAGTAGGGASTRSRFPAAFRPPAFASRVFLRPLGSYAFLTVGLPAGIPPDPVGVVTFRMRQIRPGRASSEPRGRWCAPGQPNPPGRHPPPSSGRPLFSRLLQSTSESANDEASSRIHSRSPVRPSPACGPWMEQEPSGTSPGFAPHGHP
jgi:hypothetical protein